MALIDRELLPDDTERLNGHLATCRHCQGAVARLQSATARLAKLTTPVPKELFHEVRTSLLEALPERIASLPSELEVRSCLGTQLSLRVRTSPDQVRSAIQTLLGTPHSSNTFRLMPNFVWFAAGLYGVIALACWVYWISFGGWSGVNTGDWSYMSTAFGSPYKLFLIFSAAAATVLSFGAFGQFEQKHPLHSAWLMLSVAASCRLLGRAAGAVPSLVPESSYDSLRSAGQLIAGPISLVALGLGLLVAYRAYRSLGLSLQLRTSDCVILSVGTVFTLRHLSEIIGIVSNGPVQQPIIVLNWLSDPALLFVLFTAVPLRRMALSQGGGFVAHCWSAMTAGVLLTFLGNFMIFLENYSYFTWPWTSATWLVWIPQSAAFALGPAYQFAANGALATRPSLASQAR